MPDFDFSDGLSEDWVWQRGSGASKSGRPSIAVLKADSDRPSSQPSLSSSQAPDSPTRALSERTPSQLNASPTHTWNSNGTIERREAGEVTGGLPWKKDKSGNGPRLQAPQDLFSSIGLERIFKPPTPNPDGPPSRLRKSVPKSLLEEAAIPSSPPIIPPTSLGASNKSSGRRKSVLPIRSGAPLSATLSSIREASEVEARRGSDGGSSNGSVRIKSQRQSTRTPEDGRSHRDARVFSKATNESFSAIDLASLKIDRASITAASQTLHTKMEERGIGEQARPSSRFSDHGVDYGSDSFRAERRVSQNEALDSTVHSQPEEDSVVSEALKRASKFITLRRGGYSSDDSFRRRPLSPSSFQQHSTPILPQMPRRVLEPSMAVDKNEQRQAPPVERLLSPEPAPRSSGSPLKLFDQYDTFTKDHLTRRISQFQAENSKGSSDQAEPDTRTRNDSAQEKSDGKMPLSRSETNGRRRASSFGSGALDQFSFTHTPRHSTPQILGRVRKPRRSISAQQGQRGPPWAHRGSETLSRAASPEADADQSHGTTLLMSQLQIGKRQERSPQKESRSKRRRTASRSVSATDGARLRSIGSRGLSIDSVAGKKRRDAKYDDFDEPADPEVIAARHMLRPQGASRSSSLSTLKQGDTTELPAKNRVGTTIRAIESLTDGNSSASPAKVAAVWTRKRSVTTADFFKEAQHVMANLRQRVQPSGTFAARKASSEAEGLLSETAEPFSRPPSREHSTSHKEPEEMDSVIVHHLQKFKDSDDSGLALNSSIKAIHRNSEGTLTIDLPQSDPPNIRIIEKPVEDVQDAQHNSQKSSSSGAHTTNSVPTRLSASSGAKTVIGPEKVSHLISENVGKMTFDASKHRWVKRNSLAKTSGQASSDPSEEDPLQGIPDLLVDEEEEPSVQGVAADLLDTPVDRDNTDDGKSAIEVNSSQDYPDDIECLRASFAQIRSTSQQMPSTLVSDFGSKEVSDVVIDKPVHSSVTNVHDATGGSQERSDAPRVSNERKPSKIRTVMFSSPPLQDERSASQRNQSLQLRPLSSTSGTTVQQRMGPAIAEVAIDEDSAEEVEREAGFDQDGSVVRAYLTPESNRTSQSGQRRQADGNMGLALANTALHRTPPQKANDLLRLALSSSVAFHLSPLPSFTINQADESLNLDLNYVAKRQGLHSLNSINGKFSEAVEKLVGKITDVEPNEPFWEYIRKISLAKMELVTLHMLDEFCPRVEDLNVDGNELGQLNGAPSSLRTLSIRRNCLSDLTAWGHLWNLQYLDVSSNQLTSLKAFSPLVHLRELVAEDNCIELLDGILELNGLLKLRVARNSMKKLCLERSDMCRLVELDCDENEIELVSNLDQMPALQRLSLRNNKIQEFPLHEAGTRSLMHLDLSQNDLEHMNVSRMPRLDVLVLDENRISGIEGLGNRSLSRLSWRDQNIENSSEIGGLQLDVCRNACALALSNNCIPVFAPQLPFWSLRCLELTHSGVEKLDPHFGSLVPNLRMLNLNHNAIKDLSPLLGIQFLEELHVVGNLISRLRRTASLLRLLGPNLHTFDCRDNPLTLRFYAPSSYAPTPRQALISKDVTDRSISGSLDDAECWSQYVVGPGDEEADQKHLLTLDKSTLLRRQVYEVLCLISGSALKSLDGLAAKRGKASQSQELICRLMELGVLHRRCQLEGPASAAADDDANPERIMEC